jgi:uncharacterized protein YcfJ
MNNTALAGIIVGTVVVAAAGAVVANSGINPLQEYATVVSVEPAYDVTRTPRQVCGEEAALAQSASLASPEAVSPPPADTAPEETPAKPGAGEAEAGAAGEADCLVVYDTRSVQAGFDVTYELDGSRKVVRMERDPGDRIPVEDGELVLTLR